ncbi:MAG: BON domain-containing protein [Acidobacteria bacterium]|nr:BON domain-containing protein [Acidobacteriota bacterium]
MSDFLQHRSTISAPRSANASRIATAALSLALIATLSTVGCHKPLTDAQLTTNVQSALSGDSSISQQPVQVAVQNGVVTLSGNVTDDTARSVAAQDTARVSGVKEVVNNLNVAGLAVAPTVTSPAAPTYARPTTRQERQQIASQGTLPPPADNTPAPPQPTFKDVTVAAGTDIPVRITQTLDSATTTSGTPFSGVVTREIDANGMLAIPVGAAVSGTVVEAKDAAHFKGDSLLSLQLNSIRRHGQVIPVSTDSYTDQGTGRGKNSIEKIGGGAAIGAVLGGIFGGGKGAAIGAAAGGGGAAVQGFTRGQQIRIPSETVIRFHLTNPITVRSSEPASADSSTNGPSDGLQRR